MRDYLTLAEEDSDTIFLFKQFSANAGGGQVSIAIAANRILTLPLGIRRLKLLLKLGKRRPAVI